MNKNLNPNTSYNIDNPNVTQQKTINLNDFLVRLSTQEKLKTFHADVNKDIKQILLINQSEITKDKFGHSTQSIESGNNYTKNQQLTIKLPEKVFILPSNSANNSIEQNIISTEPTKITIKRNDSQNSTLRRYAAVAPPESKQLVMQPTNKVITLDSEEQFKTDHYNSIIRPREKKIEKPDGLLGIFKLLT